MKNKMTEKERNKILYEFNNTHKEYEEKTVHELFEKQAAGTPGHVAVVDEHYQLTYKELNEKANSLAWILRRKGVVPDSITGIMVERSIEAITGMLAVLKAGGAYLPIDPEYPEDRIKYMLADSETKILLTTEKLVDKVGYDGEIICIDDPAVYSGSCANPDNICSTGHLAYIIYTSGSTGKPKGVMIEHRGVANLQNFFIDALHISDHDRILQFNNISFDASVVEIFKALLTGSTLYIVSRDIINNYDKFIEYINNNKINVIGLPPTYLEYLDHEKINNLKILITGGTKITPALVKKWAAKAQYINEYGPTETTVNATYWKYEGDDIASIPVGKPISNTRVYILDSSGKLQPIGVPGEICISSAGLARGYLNRPELTFGKFVENPYLPGERMYKSGDQGKWLPDGNIEFLGRIDSQVKIRGFRIEPGEIENRLVEYGTVKEAVVIDREDESGNKYLCAYIRADDEHETAELRSYLSEKLPDYMIPSYIIKLDKMPLTPNGKIDRKNLPGPCLDRVTGSSYKPPGNETERKMAEIWSRVLGAEKIGINDSFSELGGHSLKAIDLVARINKAFDAAIPLKELFRLSTINNICKFMETDEGTNLNISYPECISDLNNQYKAFPLTGVQLAYLIGRDDAFEMGGVATNGYTEFEIDIDLEKLNAALHKIINRHPILHTMIFEDGTQRILEKECTYRVDAIDLSDFSNAEITERILEMREAMANKILSPGTWPLFEIKAFILPNNSKYFFLITDPLICDDSSIKILIKELKLIYDNPGMELPELEYNFRDYVLASMEFKKSEIYKRDSEYWNNKLDDFPPAPVLPMISDTVELKTPKFGKFEKFFDKLSWQKLKRKAIKRNITTSSLLCSAYAYILSYWSNLNRFAINLTVFNRLPFHKDVKNIIGDFTTLMLLDINVGNNSGSFWDFALEVQDSLLEALQHRHYDGIDFIRSIGKKYNLDNKAIMPIVFTSVLNEKDTDSFDNLVDFDKIKYFSTRTSQVFIDNQVYEINGGLYITWDYVEQLFDKDVLESMFNQFVDILDQVLNGNEVSKLMLSRENNEFIKRYNDTGQNIEAGTLHGLFKKMVNNKPQNIAIKHHDKKITYKLLDEKSNRVAKYLLDMEVCHGDYVGVIGKRCIETIINILAVLKTGAAYIPVDPEYPEGRKQYIKEKSGCKLYLTPDVYSKKGLDRYSGEPLKIESDSRDMAYVLFTSGSTGMPKGVQITHAAVTNTIIDINKRFSVTEEDRILGISSLCFDLSVYDIFGALSCGALLVLIDDQRDIFNLIDVVEQERITVWNSVPAIMDMVVDRILEKRQKMVYDTLRLVLLSGDWIPLALSGKIAGIYSNAEIISLGGATEASIWSIYYPVGNLLETWKSIPYGMPLANQTFYVLNQYRGLCPVGVEGELFIGGAGVAQGYINDKEKTRAAFIDHPALGYLYKTGDYGRLKREGYIEFLGRKDNQVKIRGYRVELGEIENCLMKQENVNKAAVIVYTDPGNIKKLFAFFVSDVDVNTDELTEKLSLTLPDYMIPAKFIKIEKIPLTDNGKVNKISLEKIVDKKKNEEPETSQYRPPVNETQRRMVEIWKEIFNINSIGIDDDYYKLGGDSLTAISMISEIGKRLDLKIPVREIFRNSTIEALAGYLDSSLKEKEEDPITSTRKKDYYPTSSAQKSMYALSRVDTDNIVYHIPMALLVEGPLKIKNLESALKKIINRHEILRTGFEIIDNELVQKIYCDVSFSLELYDLNVSINGKEGLRDFTSNLCREFVKPFDLFTPPLFRAGVARLNYNKSVFILDLHHIIADGMSQGILMNELLSLYTHGELPPVRLQYKDYVEWLMESGAAALIRKQEDYWLDRFKDTAPAMNLPMDYKRPVFQSFDGGNLYFNIGEKLSGDVRRVVKETGTTLFVFLLSAYYILLYKYTGQEDLVAGSAASGRSHRDTRDIFGVFINTIALRNRICSRRAFMEFLQKVMDSTIDAFENSDYPFNELVRRIEYNKDVGRNPLFDTMFVLEDTRMFCLETKDLKFSPVIFELEASKFDLTISALETEASIEFNIEYCSALFKRETIERFKSHYIKIIEEITKDINVSIDEISILPKEEKNRLLKEFNSTELKYQDSITFLDLLKEQVFKNPENIALVDGGTTLDYSELDKKTDAAALLINKYGIGDEDVVGILNNNSIDMIIWIVGILKTGACYMPIDPEYPADRIDYMLQDSRAGLLITSRDLTTKFTAAISILYQEEVELSNICTEKFQIKPIKSGNAAYIIYTSGTTGKPKGVLVEHRGLLNLCMWHNNYYKVTKKDRASKYAGPGFDASVWEVFPYLAAGASIYIIKAELRLDVKKLNEYFEANGITISFLPTQLFEQFIKLENKSLTRLLTGADKLKYWERKNYELYNNYGPTEYTVVSTCFKIDREYENIPIGKPVSNTKIYILDRNDRIQPIGIPGELCVSGKSIARGYLNHKDLTKEKFIDNPYETGTKLYKTGDFARWLSDGNIEFMGRIDKQIKIRGYRVEPGEIESVFVKLCGIKQAVVVLKDDVLCAYVVTNGEFNEDMVRQAIKETLPEYMVPSYIRPLPSIPVSQNGKIDYRKLPSPDISTENRGYTPPVTNTEKKLVRIWEEVLALEKIGIAGNFYAVGGDSIKATIILYRINKELNAEIGISDILEKNTIKDMAAYIDQRDGIIESRTIKRAGFREYFALSPAQERIYSVVSVDKNNLSYNIPLAVLIDGKIDVNKLENSINEIINRHEILKSAFFFHEDRVVQKICPVDGFHLEYKDIRGKKNDRDFSDFNTGIFMDKFVRPFDLNRPPLIRAECIAISDECCLLMVDMHHIVSDGISISLFLRELACFYKGEKIEPLSIQYGDYAEWQSGRKKKDIYAKQEAYWLKQFKGDIPLLNLVGDYTRPGIMSFEGDNVGFTIQADVLNRLRQLTDSAGTTLYITILSAFIVLLHKYSSCNDIVVGTVTSGRSHANLENLIGMFVNTLALRSRPAGKKKFGQFLDEMKEVSLGAMRNSDYPFQDLISKLSLERDMSRNPLFDVMFVYNNMDIQEFETEKCKFTAIPEARNYSKFDLTVTVIEKENQLEINFGYYKRLFKRESISLMCEGLMNILQSIIHGTDKKIDDINLLSCSMEDKICNEFNMNQAHYPLNKTIPGLFQEAAVKYPDKNAVVCSNESISYKELDERSGRLAGLLREKGISNNAVVGLMVERSVDMIVGILAILKSGSAYMPILPEYPQERISYMLNNSGASVLLTQRTFADYIDFNETIYIDDKNIYGNNTVLAEVISNPGDLAYIIYTSGTSGTPKGVMIEHRNLVNLVYSLNDIIYKNFSGDVNIGLVASFVFDGSVKQIFPSLLLGHTLYITPDSEKGDGAGLLDFLIHNRITISDCTPAHVKIMLGSNKKIENNYHLKYLCIGGEALAVNLAEEFIDIFNPLKPDIINLYGPTETTVDASYFKFRKESESVLVPIGKPLPNIKIFILNEKYKLCPIGIPGELFISGAGVGRGYLNNEELTGKKFIVNPYLEGEKMYKTGDMARWLPDGNIEFIGRMDRQIKIRGFRIELEEIEYQLMRYEPVNQAVVLDKESGGTDKILCAYIAVETKVTIDDIRGVLEKTLPQYMIPTQFCIIDKIPVTPSGKIDRDELLKIECVEKSINYEAPSTESEKLLLEVWLNIFSENKIGINDHFYSLGGDSIKAIQLSSQIQKAGYKLDIKDILTRPYLKDMAGYIKPLIVEAEQNEIYGGVKFTPIQRYFFRYRYAGKCHFNQSVMLFNSGGLDENLIKDSIDAIISHHDALRIKFEISGKNIKQRIMPSGGYFYGFDKYDLTAEEAVHGRIKLLACQQQEKVSIEEGPLLWVSVFNTAGGDYLLINISHLVVDAVAWRIILEDFIMVYNGLKHNEPVSLQVKTHSYKVWSEKLAEYANSRKLIDEMDFWKKFIMNIRGCLPKKRNLRIRTAESVQTLSRRLSGEYTKKLLKNTNRAFNTDINDILLAALSMSMEDFFTGSGKLVINLESHGREDIFQDIDISRTVGWFTSMYPVALDMGCTTIKERIISTKETLRSIPNKGIGFGILKYLSDKKIKKDIDFNFNPEISFNYLGDPGNFNLPGDFKLLFDLTGNELGRSIREPFALNINAYIDDGYFNISFNYSIPELHETMVNGLITKYIQSLEKIVKYCTNLNDLYSTPSDYESADNLSQVDLDEIEDMVNTLLKKE